MLCTLNLTTNTTGLSIFTDVISYSAKPNLLFNNVVAGAIDEAQQIIGRYGGFIAFLKDEEPNVLCNQYVVYIDKIFLETIWAQTCIHHYVQ
jgi:hypothetical protein